MDPKHKKILQTSQTYLVKELHNVESICDHLSQSEILSSGMIDCIKHKTPVPHGQTRELLSTLPRRGKNAYEAFLTALDETENKEIADHLRQKEGRPVNMVKAKKDEFKDHDWPDLEKGVKIMQKKEIRVTEDDDFTSITQNQKFYSLSGEKKGKFIIISNVTEQNLKDICQIHCKREDSQSQTPECTSECIKNLRQHVDFDKTSMQQYFKYMKFKTKVIESKNKEELLTELKDEIHSQTDNDMLVVAFLSGGMNYEPGEMYDVEGNKIPRDEVLNVIRSEEALRGKPKVVIIDTYNFNDVQKAQESQDVLDSRPGNNENKDDMSGVTSKLGLNENTDDMFVVTSLPNPGSGPWMVGENLKGSYFIQALLDVFKNHACNKSFLQLIDQVNKRLQEACKNGKKTNVGQAVILEKCTNKDLYLFPGKTNVVSKTETFTSSDKVDIKETQPVQVSSNQTQEKVQGLPLTNQTEDKVQGSDDMTKPTEPISAEKENVSGYQWPCFEKGVSFKKKDLKQTTPEKFDEIRGRDDQIYEMAKGKKKGKVIWIVNTACSHTEPGIEADRCRENIDVDISNMDTMLKVSGFHSKDRIKNKTAEEIQTFLKGRIDEVDNDQKADYDSLVVMIFSGKTNCDAGKMYDIEGKEIVVEEEITKIICESEYFKGKPKIVMIQSYNFKDCAPFDNLDAKAENSMKIYQNCEKNNDDLFVISTIPRIEQGPWMIGENMVGSYFIQAFIHVFKNHAHDKSFLEILQEVHNHLLTVTVPKKDEKGGFSKETSTEHVADVVVTKRGQKNLYFFPGFRGPLSETGSTVCAPSDNPTNILPVSEMGSMVCAPSDN